MARKPEVTLAQHEHFAGHEKEPATGHGHHGIPNETNGGKREIQLSEALPATEAVDGGRLMEIARNSFQRRIKAESDVPDLAGEDQQDGTEFDAKLAVREQGHHGQHHSGKKTEHGNGLQDVEQRNQDHFGAPRTGGQVPIAQSKNETEGVSHADAHQRIKSVERKVARILRNPHLGMDRPKPSAPDRVNPKNHGKDKKKNGNVDQESPARAQPRGPLYSRRKRREMHGGKHGCGHGGVKPL